MDITANQLLFAFDDYMKQNGGGSKYLATKMRQIFDNKNAPLNPTTGPLSKLASASASFASMLNSLTKKIDKPFTEFKDSLKTATKSLDKLFEFNQSFIKLQNRINTVIPDPSTISPDTSYTLAVSEIEKMLERISLSVKITNISPEVLEHIIRIWGLHSNKESILSPNNSSKESGNSTSTYNNYASTNNSRSDSVSGSGGGGLIGSLLKWGGLLAGAMFSAPFIEKFLDKTHGGKWVKDILKRTFTRIGEFFDNVFKGDGVSKYAISFISLLTRAFKFVFNGVADTIERNKDAIWRNLGVIGEFIRDKVIYPLFDWVKDKISKGEIMGLVGAYLVARMVPFVGTVIKISEKLVFGVLKHALSPVKALTGVMRTLGPFLGNALVIGAIIAVGYHAVKKITETVGIIKDTLILLEEAREVTANTNKSIAKYINKKIAVTETAINSLKVKEKDGTMTAEERTQLRILELQKKQSELLHEQRETTKKINDANSSYWRAAKEAAGWNEEIKHEEELILKRYGAQNKALAEQIKQLQEGQRSSTNPIEVTPVHDAGITVVQPDSKDHHLFAKDGGPFDTFFKEMNANFDEKLSMLVALAADNIKAVIQSGGRVTQAIVATAGGGGKSPPPSYGNADPVRDFRNRANHMISR